MQKFISVVLLSIATTAALPTIQGHPPDYRVVGAFSSGELDGWREKSFRGKTDYRLVDLDGRKVLQASSMAAGSGMVKKITIDLERTPFINWSWRVENILDGVDETSRKGDDYAARIYVVKSGGWFFWKTRAINYVWSNHQPVGSTWPNAYTGNSTMLAAVGGGYMTGKWVAIKRNVRDDLKRYLGLDVKTIDAVALMTDTDDSGQTAKAYYGDIFFTSD